MTIRNDRMYVGSNHHIQPPNQVSRPEPPADTATQQAAQPAAAPTRPTESVNVPNIEGADWDPAQSIIPDKPGTPQPVQGESWGGMPDVPDLRESLTSQLSSLNSADAMTQAQNALNQAIAQNDVSGINEAAEALAASAERLSRDHMSTDEDFVQTSFKLAQAGAEYSAAAASGNPEAIAEAAENLSKAQEEYNKASAAFSQSAEISGDVAVAGDGDENVTDKELNSQLSDLQELFSNLEKPEGISEEEWKERLDNFIDAVKAKPESMERLKDMMAAGNTAEIADNAAMIFWGRGGC